MYLSASPWDGTSLSFLEAMSMGLFSIVSDIRVNTAWLEYERTGLLHCLWDSKDLEQKIMWFYDDPAIVANATIINREKVVNFKSGDRSKNMATLEKIYLNLVGHE